LTQPRTSRPWYAYIREWIWTKADFEFKSAIDLEPKSAQLRE